MERTFNRPKPPPANGGEQPDSPKLMRNVLQHPNGAELIWTNPANGMLIGTVVMRACSPQAMSLIVDDLRHFVDEEVRRLMFAANQPMPPGAVKQ